MLSTYNKQLARTKWLLFLALAIGLVAIYLYIDPLKSPLMPKCFVKTLTGFDCPGCGLQRAFHALLNGRILEAISYNYFLVYAVPHVSLIVLEKWILPQGPIATRLHDIVESSPAITLYLVLYVVWFVVRNWLGI